MNWQKIVGWLKRLMAGSGIGGAGRAWPLAPNAEQGNDAKRIVPRLSRKRGRPDAPHLPRNQNRRDSFRGSKHFFSR